MDELDDFLVSLGEPQSSEDAISPSKLGDIDLDAEMNELFGEGTPVQQKEDGAAAPSRARKLVSERANEV